MTKAIQQNGRIENINGLKFYEQDVLMCSYIYSDDVKIKRDEIIFDSIDDDVDLVISVDSIGTRHAYVKEGTELSEYITELDYYPVIDDEYLSFIEHSWRETYVTDWLYDECLQALFKRYDNFEGWWYTRNEVLGNTPESYFENQLHEHLQERITDNFEIGDGIYWEYEYEGTVLIDRKNKVPSMMANEFLDIIRKAFDNPEFPVHQRSEWKKRWGKLI